MNIKTIETNGQRIFAFGDIHGCANEFFTLFSYLETNSIITTADVLVFIGDYIDRGKYSNEVVGQLVDIQYKYPTAHFLNGNHENMLLGYFGIYPENAEAFIKNGGDATLSSYNINQGTPSEKALHQLNPLHFKFYSELTDILITEDFIFVHGGLNPDYKLDEQTEIDVLWIRDEFIVREHQFKKTIIFGHTPFKEVFVDWPYKIGIDTGVVYGNKLSCVDLTDWRYYQVYAGQKAVITGSIEKNGQPKR